MAKALTYEANALRNTYEVVQSIISSAEDPDIAKLELLEWVSCEISGINIVDYYSVLGIKSKYRYRKSTIIEVINNIKDSGIQLPLALCSLARIEDEQAKVRRTGSYYSDFRLASYLASKVPMDNPQAKIIDPACGTGVLLVACALQARTFHKDLDEYIADNLYGIDLNAFAIRGSLLSLASLLKSKKALLSLSRHFLTQDSLDPSNDISAMFGLDGFSCVVGNPPWERIKPSKYEYLISAQKQIGYGGEMPKNIRGYASFRNNEMKKAATLSSEYGIKGGVDLYHAFFKLACDLCAADGSVHLYLPAGVIRSKGQAQTRMVMTDQFKQVDISVFNNQGKFFSIDSRFKFILASLNGKGGYCSSRSDDSVSLRYCAANHAEVIQTNYVTLPVSLFNDSSEELGVPEIKDEHELKILNKIWANGNRMKSHPRFGSCRPSRELDMTLDKDKFIRGAKVGDKFAPLIEGRMVSQYRFNAKRHIEGEGRSAKWAVTPYGLTVIEPQYCVDKSVVSQAKLDRSMEVRVGYCDIVGQTNERAMQAAIIPTGALCGNKVPTITFQRLEEAYLWMGIVNSFIFDWLLRRYITTTVNHFILQNLPFPNLWGKDDIIKEIVKNVSSIQSMMTKGVEWSADDYWRYAQLRSVIDWDVFRLYDVSADDLDTVFDDFPLTDRVGSNSESAGSPTFDLIKYQAGLGIEYRQKAELCFSSNNDRPYCPNEYLKYMRDR